MPRGVSVKNPDGSEMPIPFDLSQMSWKQNTTNHKYDASTLQIVYGGSGTINMDGGNSQSAATIYAPNANFYLQGTQDLFGSVLAKTITNGGNSSVELTEGKQCAGSGKSCRPLPGKRLYAGASWAQSLEGGGTVEYRLRTADGWTSMTF